MTWDEARKYCNNQFGTDLATIQSSTDLDEAVAACSYADWMGGSLRAPPCWTGLHYLTNNDTWLWADGSSLDFPFNSSGYANPSVILWGMNEQYCVWLRPSWERWVGVRCSAIFIPLCNCNSNCQQFRVLLFIVVYGAPIIAALIITVTVGISWNFVCQRGCIHPLVMRRKRKRDSKHQITLQRTNDTYTMEEKSISNDEESIEEQPSNQAMEFDHITDLELTLAKKRPCICCCLLCLKLDQTYLEKLKSRKVNIFKVEIAKFKNTLQTN